MNAAQINVAMQFWANIARSLNIPIFLWRRSLKYTQTWNANEISRNCEKKEISAQKVFHPLLENVSFHSEVDF